MSTQCITKFIGQGGEVQAIVYRHCDGYPMGAGRDINTFLKTCKKLDDPRLDDASYLAAKYVVFLADIFNSDLEVVGKGKTRKMVRVPKDSRLDFLSVGIVNADFDDYAFTYTINCGKLDADGLPEVTCYDSDDVLPIPKGKNNWL